MNNQSGILGVSVIEMEEPSPCFKCKMHTGNGLRLHVRGCSTDYLTLCTKHAIEALECNAITLPTGRQFLVSVKDAAQSQSDLLRLQRMLEEDSVSLQEKLQSGCIWFWHEENKKRFSRPIQYFHTFSGIVSVVEPVDEAKYRIYLIRNISNLNVEVWPCDEIIYSYIYDNVRDAADRLARLWLKEGDIGDSRHFEQRPHQPIDSEKLMREIYHDSTSLRLKAQVWQHTDTRFEVRYYQWEYIELGEEAYVVLRRDKTTYAGDPQSAIDIARIEMEELAETWKQTRIARLTQTRDKTDI